MPSWPTQSDYKDALQNPDTAFRDPELKASQAERSPMGVPRARSGAFASVYKMSRGSKAIALKLFNFPNEDRAARYLAVSDYLKTLGAKKPSALVGFEYHPEGIRIGRQWYPTLTMEWVKGKTLGEWVREVMERKSPDVAALRAMADAWVQLVLDIQAAKIAHGDLQHDNVMVVGNAPVLVDYDGMCVPALAPTDPAARLEQLEFGKPAYQHPARPAQKLGPHLDHFAAWIILIALRASAADPALYTRFVTKTENENLLFTPPDMATPGSSALWKELLRSKDSDVRDWSKAVRESLDKPFERIPTFTVDPFIHLRKLIAAVPKDWNAVAAEADRLGKAGKKLPPDLAAATDPLRQLRELCSAARKDYAAIAVEADALTRSGKAVPADLKPIAIDAVKRVNCRDAVRIALDARKPRDVRTVFQKQLLEGWAEKQLIADAEVAIGQVGVLDKLKAAVAVPGDGRKLIALWKAEGLWVAAVPEANAYQAEAAKWEARINAADAFVKLYANGAAEQQLATAWQNVQAVGKHPDLKPEHVMRGEQAAKRAVALAKLAAVPPVPSFANDTALVAAWGDGSAVAGCKEGNRFVAPVKAAKERLAKVEALKRAIEKAEAGQWSESAVVSAAVPLASYDHPYKDRVKIGAKSVEALAALKTAVDEKPPSDRRIAAALDGLRAVNSDLLNRLDKMDPSLAAAAVLAGRRRQMLDEFAALQKKYHDRPDKQDRRWVKLWVKYQDLLKGRRDTEELRDRLTLAVNRTQACAAILEALEGRELFRLRALFTKHGESLQNYPPLADRRVEIDELLTKADRVIEIQTKLQSADELPSEDDLRFLREHHASFRPADKNAIVERVKDKLRTDAKLVAGRPPIRVIPNGRASTVIANWAWAGYGLVSYCLLAVDKARHMMSPAEAEQHALLKCHLRDHTAEGGGRRLFPPLGANEVFITVWAVVELGWTTVCGPPLHLGPVNV